jgi:hypothetical protein
MTLREIEAALLDGPFPETSLKGPRSYIQSADLWNAIEGRLGAAASTELPLEVSLTFRRLSAAVPAIVANFDEQAASRFADLRIACGEGAVALALIETQQQVTARTRCPEAEIIPTIELARDVATLSVQGCGTPVERLIAAVKHLHLCQVSAEVKWLAGRLALKMPFTPQSVGTIEARLSKQLPHGATLSRIRIDGKDVGTVIFSPAPKAT